MELYALLHSKEDDTHTHTQEKDRCKVVKFYNNNSEAIVITPSGVKCTAIYNFWLGWMADDLYGIVKD